ASSWLERATPSPAASRMGRVCLAHPELEATNQTRPNPNQVCLASPACAGSLHNRRRCTAWVNTNWENSERESINQIARQNCKRKYTCTVTYKIVQINSFSEFSLIFSLHVSYMSQATYRCCERV